MNYAYIPKTCIMSCVSHKSVLTFKRMGGYLNFSIWLMQNVSFEQKKIILLNRRDFVENKTDYAACPKTAVHFLVA
jgi:hypothetical protein